MNTVLSRPNPTTAARRGEQTRSSLADPEPAPMPAVPPTVAERVFAHVKRLAAQHGIEVREGDVSGAIETRSITKCDRLISRILDPALPALRKAWLVAEDLGYMAGSTSASYPWMEDPFESEGICDNEARTFACSLLASLTAGELLREVSL